MSSEKGSVDDGVAVIASTVALLDPQQGSFPIEVQSLSCEFKSGFFLKAEVPDGQLPPYEVDDVASAWETDRQVTDVQTYAASVDASLGNGAVIRYSPRNGFRILTNGCIDEHLESYSQVVEP